MQVHQLPGQLDRLGRSFPELAGKLRCKTVRTEQRRIYEEPHQLRGRIRRPNRPSRSERRSIAGQPGLDHSRSSRILNPVRHAHKHRAPESLQRGIQAGDRGRKGVVPRRTWLPHFGGGLRVGM